MDDVEQVRTRKSYNALTFILLFVFVALATCGIIKAIKGESILPVSHNLILDQSISEDQKAFLEKYIKSDSLTEDLKVSSKAQELKFTNESNTLIYDVVVPTVSWDDSRQDIRDINTSDVIFKSIKDYENTDKLLSIEGEYYLDTFSTGANFTLLQFEGADSEKVITTLRQAEELQYIPTKNNTLSFAQTGVTAITRNMTNTLNGKAGGNGAYFAENIKDFLSSKDITHISNEVSFTDNCPGGRNTLTLCSDWRVLDTITAIGTDIVELTGNHNNNYGYDANIETINTYYSLSMKAVGGGINSEEASKPLRIVYDKLSADPDASLGETLSDSEESESEPSLSSQNEITNLKGANITFIAVNNSTSSTTNGELSTGNTPGANGYNEELVSQQISEAKARGDFVLVDIQFYECYCYPDGFVEYPVCDSPISNQKEFFRHIIDLGADMVVGTQAHQTQTFEYYNGKPIYYGLGNLFFDQTYWPDTETGIILTYYFVNGKLLQTRISPTIYQEEHQTRLMDTDSAEKFINRLLNSSPKGE